MSLEYIKVTFEKGELEAKFPEIFARKDLNNSDKIRLALGLVPRQASAGAPKGNKNGVGNRGRSLKKQDSTK